MTQPPATDTTAPAPAASRAGLYLALLQLVFTLGWTIYVVYMPQLAAKVGIPAAWLIFILMIDQAVFTVTDTLMGVAADKLTPIAGKLSRFVASLTLISCLAFLALPFVADLGPDARWVFLGLILVWIVTSSALRAPPLALLGKYAARPSVPWLACLAMLGSGLAGAVSPYLGVALREIDPRIPFLLSSVVLLATAFGLSWIERTLRENPSRLAPAQPIDLKRSIGALSAIFVVAVLVLAIGYQLHFSVNSGPLFLRFAQQPDLQWLMPVYWIGFNIAMFPASFIVRRFGGLLVMAGAALLGAGAVLGMENASDLNSMLAMQFLAGAAWGCILMSAVAAALALGDTGAEGKVLGLMFSATAIAALARIVASAAGITRNSDYQALLQWTPVICWTLGGIALTAVVAIRLRRMKSGGLAAPATI